MSDVSLRVKFLEEDLAKMREDLNKLGKGGKPTQPQVQFPDGSIGKMKQQIKSLTDEIDHLGDAKGIKQKQHEIKALEKEMGQLQGTGKGLGGMFGNLGGGGGGGLASMAGSALKLSAGFAAAGLAADIASKSWDAFLEKDTAMADLSAITGLTGKALEAAGDQATDLSNKFGSSVVQNIEAAKVVLSKLGPELAKNADAMGSISENINVLSRTSKGLNDTAKTAGIVADVTNSMGLANASAAEKAEFVARATNVLAAAAKAGAMEADQEAEAFLKVGGVLEATNVVFEEGAAMVEVLATKYAQGSENGTMLKNTLLKLEEGRFMQPEVIAELEKAGVDMKKLSDHTLPAADRLAALKPIVEDTALMTKMFGTENIVAAQHLVNNTEAVKKMTKEVTGTTVALDQCKTNMDSYEARWSKFWTNITNMGVGVITGLRNGLVDLGAQLSDSFTRFTDLLTITDTMGDAVAAKKTQDFQAKFAAKLIEDARKMKAQAEAEFGVAPVIPDGVVIPETKEEIAARKKKLKERADLLKKANDEELKDRLDLVNQNMKLEEMAYKAAEKHEQLILDMKIQYEEVKLDVMKLYGKKGKELAGQIDTIEILRTQRSLVEIKKPKTDPVKPAPIFDATTADQQFSAMMKNMAEGLDKDPDVKAFKDGMEQLGRDIGNAFSAAVEAGFSTNGILGAFKDLGKQLIAVAVEQALKLLIVDAALGWAKTIAQTGPLGIIAGAGVSAFVLGLSGIIKGAITGMETGGVLVGENGPEVIAPARDYSEFMGMMMGTMTGFVNQALMKIGMMESAQNSMRVQGRFSADPITLTARGDHLYAVVQLEESREMRRTWGGH